MDIHFTQDGFVEWWACPEESKDGYLCGLPYKHKGPHVAKGCQGAVYDRWHGDTGARPDMPITMTHAEFKKYVEVK